MTLDLFPSVAASSPATYAAAWDSWLAHEQRAGRLRQDSSIEVYGHMWTALTAWLVAEGIAMADISAADLERFMGSRGQATDVSDRHAWRFLRLIDRVFLHTATALGGVPNRAAEAVLATQPQYRYANATAKDPLPAYLAADEAKRLVTYLSAVRPGRSAAGRAWQEVRNRCAVALMLGAGVTPGEVRVLATDDVVFGGSARAAVPWKLRIAGRTETPQRETPLAPWAGQLLAYWLDIRQAQALPGTWLLPSTRTGKPWSKVAQYEATKEVLSAAGVDDVQGGSFRLRHTFVLRQLKRGRSASEIASWIGVTDPAVMARYQRVVLVPVDVV